MATKKLKKTFAVKIQTMELGKDGMGHTVLESLGENLSWTEAVELCKANRGSYIHRENRVYKIKKIKAKTQKGKKA